MTSAARFAPALLAALLTLAANSATAQEVRTVVLAPHKHADGKRIAIAGAKWLAIKADREAAVVVAETDMGSAVRVIKGAVTIHNLADRSVVKVAEGCAYETVVRADATRRQPQAFLGQAAETIALFETKSNTSYLYRMESAHKLKVEILTPPLDQNYSIGDVAAAHIPMARMLTTHFPPAGILVWHAPTPVLAEQGGTQ